MHSRRVGIIVSGASTALIAEAIGRELTEQEVAQLEELQTMQGVAAREINYMLQPEPFEGYQKELSAPKYTRTDLHHPNSPKASHRATRRRRK